MYGRGQIGFGPPETPQLIKTLMIANGVVYLAQILTGGYLGSVYQFGVVSPEAVWGRWELWRIFTYMWLHTTAQGLPLHIMFNMFSLWMFGSTLCVVWGEQRFLRYYLTCGVGAGFLIATIPVLTVWLGWTHSLHELTIPTLGASGAVMGVLLAYSFTWPDRTIMMMMMFPMKAIWLIPVVLVLDLMSGGNVSHLGHLSGVLVGWIYLLNEGRTPGAPTLQGLAYKWKRYQMRRKIRAVHEEDRRERQRRWREENDDDRRNRFH